MKATGIIVLILVIFAAAVLAEVWREMPEKYGLLS